MKEIIGKKESHVICYDDVDVIHYVVLNKGNKLQTESSNIEQFDTLDLAKARVLELTGNENYFDENCNS